MKYKDITGNLLILLALICSSLPVLGNAGPPSTGGATTGEPSGLEKIFILRETLTIDMRPLAEIRNETDDATVLVEAVYEIENRGEAREQELIFAVGSERVEDFRFWIDDREIDLPEVQTGRDGTLWTNRIESWNLPESWRPPSTTPWKNDGDSPRNLEYYPKLVRSIPFKITIPPGRHSLRAAYKSSAGAYTEIAPYKAWQFAYILAPARQWAGFGDLAVTVRVPENWEAVTEPALEREGNILKGNFSGVPADALAITTRAAVPWRYTVLSYFYLALFLAATFVFPVYLFYCAWKKGGGRKSTWLRGIVLSLLWAISVGLTGTIPYLSNVFYLIPDSPQTTVPQGGAYMIFLLVFFIPVFFVIGLAVWFLTVYAARRRIR